jgi:signal transduction histidine kinase
MRRAFERQSVVSPGRWSVIGAAALLMVSVNCWAQKASNWRVYRVADGLPESGCIAVTVSPQKKVLARHLRLPFVTELDGYTNTVLPAPETGKSRVYQSPGGQLWTVVPGGLLEFLQGAWVEHPLPALATGGEFGARVIDPVPLYPVRQGLVLFLQPDGLMEFNAESLQRTRVLRSASQTQIGKFYGMAPGRDGGLWIGGERGLARVPGPLRSLRPETKWREFLLPDSLGVRNLQLPQEERLKTAQPDGSFFVTALAETLTNESKVAVCFDGDDWKVLRAGDYRLRHAWRGPEKTQWGMAINSVFRWEKDAASPQEAEDISARQYFDVAVEVGGAFWLATSDGLYRYAALLWSCPEVVRGVVSPVQCLAPDRDMGMWFCTAAKLYSVRQGKLSEYALPASASHLRPRALYSLAHDSLIVVLEDPESTGADELFRFTPSTGTFAQVAAGSRRLRVLGMLGEDSICLQNLAAADLAQTSGLETYNGQAFEPFPAKLEAGSLGTNLNVVFTTQSGDVWVGGNHGAALLHEKSWSVFSFAEMPDGRVWSAGQDQVWEFDGRNWSLLRRGFDRINGLLRTRDGSVWVASNNGAYRFFRGAWVEHGMEEGLPAVSVRGLLETSEGLWLATTRGLTLFHPQADPDTDPPTTWVTKIAGEDQSGGEGGPVIISFSGRDKWNYAPQSRLLFSYRLDDREWSPFQDQDSVSFSELGSGKHYFQVRAMDRNSNVDPRPFPFEFSIVLPWYRETRLVLIALTGAAAALFFGGLALNKHLQLLRSYAEVEQKVAERTRQLEIASRELFQSQKMNALGTLAAGIAHDFNNILSIIKGSAQIIEDNLHNPQKIQTRADRIKTVVEQGAGIVKAMLGFSRDSGPLPELCSVNVVVGDTVRLLGDRFLREVQVRFEPASELPQTATTRDFVQQILLNFIFNAAESMANRREIIVATCPLNELPQELALAPDQASGYIAIRVQDFGSGIPRENMLRIFEPFFTTKALSVRRGTGLGLSMAYELAKKLGAGLAVQSVVGQGSTFMLILPIRGLPQPPASPPTETPRTESTALK